MNYSYAESIEMQSSPLSLCGFLQLAFAPVSGQKTK